jgi:hypothetical protein
MKARGRANAPPADNKAWFEDPRAPDEINYGYLLRACNADWSEGMSDILIETPLLRFIRHAVYERPPKPVRNNLTAMDRLRYNAMRAFLTVNNRSHFVTLYPQWAHEFQMFGTFTNNIIEAIIHTQRQRRMAPSTRAPVADTTTKMVAETLLNCISSHESFSPFGKDAEDIIRNYVIQPLYTYLYLRALPRAVGQPGEREWAVSAAATKPAAVAAIGVAAATGTGAVATALAAVAGADAADAVAADVVAVAGADAADAFAADVVAVAVADAVADSAADAVAASSPPS